MRNSITSDGHHSPLAQRFPFQRAGKDTDHTGTKKGDLDTTAGHTATLCQGKAVL